MILLFLLCLLPPPNTCPPPAPKFLKLPLQRLQIISQGTGNQNEETQLKPLLSKSALQRTNFLLLTITTNDYEKQLLTTNLLNQTNFKNFYRTFFSQALSPDTYSSRAYIHELFQEKQLYWTVFNLIVFRIYQLMYCPTSFIIIDCLLKIVFWGEL